MTVKGRDLEVKHTAPDGTVALWWTLPLWMGSSFTRPACPGHETSHHGRLGLACSRCGAALPDRGRR